MLRFRLFIICIISSVSITIDANNFMSFVRGQHSLLDRDNYCKWVSNSAVQKNPRSLKHLLSGYTNQSHRYDNIPAEIILVIEEKLSDMKQRYVQVKNMIAISTKNTDRTPAVNLEINLKTKMNWLASLKVRIDNYQQRFFSQSDWQEIIDHFENNARTSDFNTQMVYKVVDEDGANQVFAYWKTNDELLLATKIPILNLPKISSLKFSQGYPFASSGERVISKKVSFFKPETSQTFIPWVESKIISTHDMGCVSDITARNSIVSSENQLNFQ